ncbi:MAG: hypothetical protein ACTMIR_07095 [Cellulomonadaceae bacterium]
MDVTTTVSALVKVIGVGLVLGAGLPALFALGLRLTSVPVPHGAQGPDARGHPIRTGRLRTALGAACFAVVAVAVVVGVVWIVLGDGH